MLPIEIQGLIILEAGIPLLSKISKSLRKLHHMDIIKYYATLPITPYEIEKYIVNKPTRIQCYKINNGLNVEGYILQARGYYMHYNILGNDTIHDLPRNDESLISKNYDLYTIYRCRKSIYIKKILYDTFHYYCSLLTEPALSLYLYTNIIMLDKSYGAISSDNLLSKNKHEQLKLEIIDLINQLPVDDTPLNMKLIIYPV